MGNLRRERDLHGQAGLVCGHRDNEQIARHETVGGPIEAIEVRVDERVGQLPRPIGPVVAMDDRVAVANAAVHPRR